VKKGEDVKVLAEGLVKKERRKFRRKESFLKYSVWHVRVQ
jgi:hypothetical protein